VTFFDFTTFAREIYSDNPQIYALPMSLRAQVNAGRMPTLSAEDVRTATEEKFLLPAIYGGEVGDVKLSKTFEALVVLEAPSVSFTREEWKKYKAPCATPAEAIDRHRKIFFKWAFVNEFPRKLFEGLLKGKPATADEFFGRLYITDIWKDAVCTAGRKEPDYKRYWQSQLEKEIRGIRTDSIVFVGNQAKTHGEICVPKDKRLRRYPLPFPTSRNNSFDTELQKALEQFHRDTKIAELEREIEELQRKIKAPRG
jgi:hypothetical protein